MIGRWIISKTKNMPKRKEGKILNEPKELPVDAVGKSQEADWQIKHLGAESETKLEQDQGSGKAIKLFFFDFSANPAAFKDKWPTAQEIFNSHLKQIEVKLWTDGWKIYSDAPPRLMLSKSKKFYRIIVPAELARGRFLREEPQTLTQITHDTTKNSE